MNHEKLFGGHIFKWTICCHLILRTCCLFSEGTLQACDHTDYCSVLLAVSLAGNITYGVLRSFLSRARQEASGFAWASLSLKTAKRHTTCLIAWHFGEECSLVAVSQFCVWAHKPAKSSATASDQGCTCILCHLEHLWPWVPSVSDQATLQLCAKNHFSQTLHATSGSHFYKDKVSPAWCKIQIRFYKMNL